MVFRNWNQQGLTEIDQVCHFCIPLFLRIKNCNFAKRLSLNFEIGVKILQKQNVFLKKLEYNFYYKYFFNGFYPKIFFYSPKFVLKFNSLRSLHFSTEEFFSFRKILFAQSISGSRANGLIYGWRAVWCPNHFWAPGAQNNKIFFVKITFLNIIITYKCDYRQ